MLSYGLDSIKNSYDFFPNQIKVLVDIFSINPEYLIGNAKNHILSDQVIKEILIYIRENISDRTPFTNEDVIDRLMSDPHGLMDEGTYRNFVQTLFYQTIVAALSQPYSKEDGQPIAFNVLWKEIQEQNNVLSRIKEYKSWVDKFIWNEIEHPLNDSGMANTLWSQIETVKNQKKMSSKFNPFKLADHIFFNGLNPNNELSNDELDLVERVIDYHSKAKYDYQSQQFVDDPSTKYAYYRELEFFEWVKLVMFVMNNIKSFNMDGLTYDISSNKFIHTLMDTEDCMRVVNIFNQNDKYIVKNASGGIALNYAVLLKVSKFLCDYVFHVQAIRENVKTIAQKHAMRGSGALLVHIVNDYLIKELPIVRRMTIDGEKDTTTRLSMEKKLKFGWEIDSQFNNYGNVKVLEYEDDNEYFNIDPEKDVRFTERTNVRYWEQLDGMGYEDSLGVLTKGQIRDFYREVLGMGKLQPKKPKDYDDVCDFLVDLFRIGANPVEWRQLSQELYNPVDDIDYDYEEKYGYTKEERLAVQTNVQLRKNQERQFIEYSGNDDVVGESLYDYVNSKLFYWKNVDYSSHVLHPFMYNIKLWNKLNNIIINGYKDYINHDIVDYLSSKVKFDELFGVYGEGRNFWKYNVVDLTGYTTRYEAAIKDEHRDDFNKTTSELTGYDGLFYPDAAQDFLDIALQTGADFDIPAGFHTDELSVKDNDDKERINKKVKYFLNHRFIAAIYSVYWQYDNVKMYGEEVPGLEDNFYIKWYSHLNYTRSEYQKIAMQLWYWRDRIVELITNEYPITKYCLDIQNNSLILVSTFKGSDEESNPYLIDLRIESENVQNNRSGNQNTHVSFCDNKIQLPSELWIRWKSNPLALPAFDVYYDEKTGDGQFDTRFRTGVPAEMGQLTHTNNTCNESFKVVLRKWRESYDKVVHWNNGFDWLPDGLTQREVDMKMGNRLPVFFDMEQSTNVLALSSWYSTDYLDSAGIQHMDEFGNPLKMTCCAKNPYHILSIERVGMDLFDYNYEQYVSSSTINGSGVLNGWMFDRYHYCQANGSILIPFYRFDCHDTVEDQNLEQVVAGPEQDGFEQKVSLRMFVVQAQMLKGDNYATADRIYQLADVDGVDLNGFIDFDDDRRNYLFGHPMKVCRNTNLVFSTYEKNGMNRVKCAFLGQMVVGDEYGNGDTDVYQQTSVKRSAADAMTRYEFDSKPAGELGQLKRRYFRATNHDWEQVVEQERKYIDAHVHGTDCGTEDDTDDISQKFNSYDSLDKYVFVLDFEPSIDHKSMFDMGWRDGMSTQFYNILSDAGCIPHFAYQSLVNYGDKDGGIAYTWRNKFLDRKDHLMFELLGIDDIGVRDVYLNMQRMVVDDLTDNCKTLINPMRMMDDIYRIWCENRTVRVRPDKYPYDMYFSNEYREYVNPEFEFNGETHDWNMVPAGEDGFELELPASTHGKSMTEQELADGFKEVLDDYYVTIVRADNGEFLNEKRYILPPTPLSEIMVTSTDDGFRPCNLSRYQSAMTRGGRFLETQVLFTGTQNPFNYSSDGTRAHSKPEELQYGNGICGVGSIGVKVDITSRSVKSNKVGPNGYVQYKYNSGTSLFNLDDNHMP